MGRARSPGVSLCSTARLNLDFSLREKSFSEIVSRSRRGAWKGARDARAGAGELPLAPTTACVEMCKEVKRVAVGAPGRVPAMRGPVRASFHSPLQRRV